MIRLFNDKVDKHRGVFYTFLTPKEAKTYPQRAVWLFAYDSKQFASQKDHVLVQYLLDQWNLN